MRIVYLTDIHDAFKALIPVLEKTSADVYILAGDLIYRVFPRYEDAWRFMELQERLSAYRTEKGSSAGLMETAKAILKDPNSESRLVDQAKEYIKLGDKAERYLNRSYGRLEDVLGGFPDKNIVVLPGNYDTDLRGTALNGRSLHLNTVEVDGLKIAGYGGAKVRTPALPDHLQVPFVEHTGDGRTRSEAGDYFRLVKPDILVAHHPPYGRLDNLKGYGRVGSVGIRDYVDEFGPALVLSGHIHEDWGGVYFNGTAFFNPSNFGKTVEVTHDRPGGYFLDLILEGGAFQVATLRQAVRGRFYDVADYRIEPKQGRSGKAMEELVVDEKRYIRMGGRADKPSHIRPIRRLQAIRSFFLRFETPESKALVRELRGIYRDLQEQGFSVGFDLLGSLNFGMAEKGSDLDLVVYLRSGQCSLDDLDTCKVPPPLAAVFEELEKRRLEVEVLDSLDLDRISEAVEREDSDDGHLQRFVFYRAVCRPVNLRLIKRFENRLLRKERFRKETENKLREYLRILVSSMRHVKSFEKYAARLRESGVRIPADVERKVKQYLKGDP